MKVLIQLSKNKAVTLLEIIIVVTIVAILATFALPAYYRAKRRALDREAQSQLKLIQAAEDRTYLETGHYRACNTNIACNTTLKIDLPASRNNGGNWNYRVYGVGSSPPRFTARAQGPGGATWYIDQNDVEAHQ